MRSIGHMQIIGHPPNNRSSQDCRTKESANNSFKTDWVC